ncbi:MAG: hypothetical protein C0598_11875 [Marinilabiliales bacterium]|nr:MAG: hypothetical protein C0598_11875 [Marinilabiliales bacterium]
MKNILSKNLNFRYSTIPTKYAIKLSNNYSKLFFLLLLMLSSCNNKDQVLIPVIPNVSFPLLVQQHEQYYGLESDCRSIEIVFNDNIFSGSIDDAIVLTDKDGSLEDKYQLISDGKIVFLRFNEGFNLKSGWRYILNIDESLLMSGDKAANGSQQFEFRTNSKYLHEDLTSGSGDTTERTLIACISDIHCGDVRATNHNYSWFNKNADALYKFLSYVESHPRIKQLVIMGDLFDEWMVPYYAKPFDTTANITNSIEYFRAIAHNAINKPVFDKLSDISKGGIIDVVYVPGNHDMLVTQDVITELIPGAIWKGDAKGLGKYNPVDKIHLEHGHRYDFFNCPQPLINEDKILPPGYFVTRLYASGLASRTDSFKDSQSIDSDIEFVTAWTAAFGYTIADFSMNPDTIPMDSSMVKMTGIDGYSDDMSFNGALHMYDADIEELWKQTQEINLVPNTLSVFLGLLNGTKLYGAALFEYLTDYFSSDQPKIVAFGHSHKPEIKVFPFENAYTGIYANSGSWIDPDQSKYNTRTFLIIEPAKWSDSEIDVVSLYQFNKDSENNTDDYKPYLIKEESIKN